MSQEHPRTPRHVRRFEIFFGRLFLAIGLGALLMAGVLFVTLRADLGMGNRIWAFLISPLTIGVIFVTIGVVYLRRGLRQARREERLLQHGTTTEATVTRIEETGTRRNRRRLWRINFAFEDLHGTPREGRSGYLSAEEAQSYRVGERAFIRYDPEQPTESIWLGQDELTDQR
jgi:hypothetical protein